MALKVTLLHTIVYEKSSRAELFRCGNCESPRGDLSFANGTESNTITYHFYEKSSRAELFRCFGDLSFHTKFLAKSGLRAAVEC